MSSPAALIIQQTGNACREGHMSAALETEIRTHLSAPFQQTITTTTATAATPAGTNVPLPSTSSGFGPNAIGFGAQQQQPQQQQPLSMLGAVGSGPAAPSSPADVANERSMTAHALLQLLLLCGEPEQVVGLNKCIAVIAPSAAASTVQFLRSECAPVVMGPSIGPHGKSSPVLLSAQCLLLLTRHFQMRETLVKEICVLLETLLEEVRRLTLSGGMGFAAFRQNPSTAEVCALTWLVTMSLCNTLTVWRDVMDASGEAKENVLLRTNIAAELESWVARLRNKVENARHAGPLSFVPGGIGGSATTSSATTRARALAGVNMGSDNVHSRGHHRWVDFVEGYISMIVLSIGVFLCGRRDERGLEKAFEAFVGDRVQNPGTVYRGRVMRNIIKLAPSRETLVMPMKIIYIIPYEIAAYMLDEMIPTIKHVADTDVESYRRYHEELQNVEDARRGGTDVFFDDIGVARYSATGELRQSANLLRERQGSFMFETVHILQALTVCLENLPSSVLNPDKDSDCAVSFFVFSNCMRHMPSLFEAQRSNVPWEPYTLKIVSAFLDLLAMIGRNPQYTERVVSLFSQTQVECAELQWPSLLAQAQECAGVTGNSTSLLTLDLGGAMAAVQKSTGSPTGARHRHFTREYLVLRQQEFVASVFMLLRQLATHPKLRGQVSSYVTLNVALEFLYAPRLSQSVLGRTLSLIGALITSSEDVARVWAFLADNHLLRWESRTPVNDSHLGGITGSGVSALDDGENAVRVETHSLLGHCQSECHKGTYSITIGFLDLMLALLNHQIPDLTHAPTYTKVIRFVAEDIFRGLLRRFFESPNGRYTVAALAAAVLNRALTLQNGSESVVPFTVIMACSRAPADVLGEALQIISEAADAPNELLNYQRAAVRQCLGLLKTAITVKREQGLENLFTFDARTANNRELAARLLPLSASVDSLLANKALQLLLLIPQPTVSQAAQMWFTQPGVQEAIITPFVSALRPEAVSSPIVHVPPALAVLDHDEEHLLSPDAEVETKSLIMDLLIQHAQAPQPSITSWLCGYPLYGSGSYLVPGYCLEPVITGANSPYVGETHPRIAVQYVKLLYLLRANPSLGKMALHHLLEGRGNGEMFYDLQKLNPKNCSPLIMSKYAFVMKLLAMEMFGVGTNSSLELHTPSPCFQPTNMAHLVLLLMQSSSASSSEQLSADVSFNEGDISGVAVDFAHWPSSCLKLIPAFPSSCNAPGGLEKYILRTSSDTPVYSIKLLYEAFQKESLKNHKKPLSEEEMREKLHEFVYANHCLEAYAGAVQFIDGWCSLVNITATVVDTISPERLVDFAQCILECMQIASSLTVAAQEQIVYLLSQTLSTLMVQLGRKIDNCEENMDESAIHGNDPYAVSGMDPHGVGDGVGGGEGVLTMKEMSYNRDAPGAVLQSGNIGDGPMRETSGLGFRAHRTRVETNNALTITQPPNATSILMEATSGSLIHRKRDSTGNFVLNHVETTGPNIAGSWCSLRSFDRLLKMLLVTTVQCGPRVPNARQHLYRSIVDFLATPGIAVDDFALQRYQNALFDVLVGDIAAAASTENKLAALVLLLQLMHLSPQLCEMFCVPSTGDGASQAMMTCVTSCIQSLDEEICSFFIHGSGDVSSILWRIEVIFDLFIVFSRHHSLLMIQINALSHCMAMKSWKTSARLALGYGNNASGDAAVSSAESFEVYREVFRNLLLSTTRWFNTILTAMGNSESALIPIATFLRANQQLFQSVLTSPIVDARQRNIDSLTLELYAEIGTLLQWMASSSLAEACRALVSLFALPDLLVVLTKIDFLESPIFAPDLSMTTPSAAMSVTKAPPLGAVHLSGSIASNKQRQLTAIAVQQILQFLVRSESITSLSVGQFTGNVTEDSNLQPRLCEDPRSRELMLTVTQQVVATVENIYNGQILRTSQFSPYLLALQGLVLLLHSFVIADRVLSKNRGPNDSGNPVLRVLEEAQRVVNMLKAFHSDYLKGLKVRRVGRRWSVTAPSLSNNSLFPSITAPPHGDNQPSSGAHEAHLVNASKTTRSITLSPGDSRIWRGLQRGPNTRGANVNLSTSTLSPHPAYGSGPTMDPSSTNQVSALSHTLVHDATAMVPVDADVSIGALVEAPRADVDDEAEGDWQRFARRDAACEDVVPMESLLRDVKVAISNAIRAASLA